MLEKIRIHRAMLELNEAGGFSAKDLAALTGAIASTIRKTIERDIAENLITVCGARRSPGRGGPEKLYQVTERGLATLTQASSAVYAALVAAPLTLSSSDATREAGTRDGSSVVADEAMYAIDAALETLLAPVCGREKLLERLAIAEAELEEGIRDRGDTGLRALEIRKLVREAASRVGALAEGDDFGIVRKHLLAAVESVTSTEAPAFLDRLVGLLPELRRAAIEHASNRTEAETLVFNVFRDLLSDPTAAGSDTTALFRRAHWLLMHGRAEGKLGNAEETNRLLHQIKAGQDAAAADIFRLVNGMSMISTELERVPKTEPGLSDMQIPIDPLLQALMQRVQKPN